MGATVLPLALLDDVCLSLFGVGFVLVFVVILLEQDDDRRAESEASRPSCSLVCAKGKLDIEELLGDANGSITTGDDNGVGEEF
jgi:hypothetical protein